MGFNIPDEILEDIFVNAISSDFTNTIQTENIKLNIVDVDTINNILMNEKTKLDSDRKSG